MNGKKKGTKKRTIKTISKVVVFIVCPSCTSKKEKSLLEIKKNTTMEARKKDPQIAMLCEWRDTVFSSALSHRVVSFGTMAV